MLWPAALLMAFLAAVPAAAAQADLCSPSSADLKTLSRQAAARLAESRYEEAEQLYEAALKLARKDGRPELLVRLLNNLAAARMYRQRYTEAFDALSEAQRSAAAAGLAEAEAAIWSNLASLYGMLAAWPAAERALAEAAELMPQGSRYRAALLAQRVRLALQREDCDWTQTSRLWMAAMRSAEDLGDWQVQRHLWDDLAAHALATGQIELADAAVANSFRLVTLHRLPDPGSMWMLVGRVRLAQGRPHEAIRWLERTAQTGLAIGTPVSALHLASAWAEAAARAKGPKASLRVCRNSWPEVIRWRQTVLADPQAEMAADVALAALLDQYVAAAMSATPPSRAKAVEAWAVVEQSRSLNVLRQRARRLSRAEPAPAQDGRGIRLRPTANGGTWWRATEDGSRRGRSQPASPPELLARIQARLRPTQALFCFWLGKTRPTVWAITEGSIHHAELPSRDRLLPLLRGFREQVNQGQDPSGLPWQLMELLFSRLPAKVLEKPEWLVSADDELLLIPLGALRFSPGESGRYLAELRQITLLPSALWLLEEAAAPAPARLLAVGDLVHNTADPRWRREPPAPDRRRSGWPLGLRALAAGRAADLELPSLPGSRNELAAIRRLWAAHGLETTTLSGTEATRAALEHKLQQGWTDLYFATHVLPAPGAEAYRNRIASYSRDPVRILFPSGEPFLALSLRSDGRREGLTAASLSSLPPVPARVVLNGCATGAGVAQTGAGIYSFASAWLAAGAISVVASLWQVNDDGALFEAYYRLLLSGARPSVALQAAQAAMIRSGTWRAQPRYWAAYFHFGKD